MADVIDEVKRLALMVAENPNIQSVLVADNILSSQDVANARGTPSKKLKASAATLPRVLGMRSAATELAEAGIVGLECGSSRNGDRVGHLRLSVGEEEIKFALRDDTEVKGLGFAN